MREQTIASSIDEQARVIDNPKGARLIYSRDNAIEKVVAIPKQEYFGSSM